MGGTTRRLYSLLSVTVAPLGLYIAFPPAVFVSVTPFAMVSEAAALPRLIVPAVSPVVLVFAEVTVALPERVILPARR